jgi:putative transposase
MILSHKIELIPNEEQKKYFLKAAGTSRFVYNWALAEWNRQYKNGEKPNYYKLKKEFNAIKYQEFPWLKEIHKDAHAKPFEDIKNAFQKFFKKVAKYPKFKKKSHGRSFYISNDKFLIDGFIIKLPKIGKIKLTEKLRFNGKIMCGTVSQDVDRWFISISVDMDNYNKNRKYNNIVGIDLGINSALTLSTGEKILSPKPFKKYLKKIKKLSIKHSKKQKMGKNRKKIKIKLAKLYRKIRKIRTDFIHKTVTRICRENQTIIIENLNIKKMIKNHKFAASILDIGFYEIRRQFEYKSKIYGNKLIIADKFFPSSKTCSRCGNIKDHLELSIRIYCCDECKNKIDRDINAAINLRTLGLRGS